MRALYMRLGPSALPQTESIIKRYNHGRTHFGRLYTQFASYCRTKILKVMAIFVSANLPAVHRICQS
jgi:hypothetical protein